MKVIGQFDKRVSVDLWDYSLSLSVFNMLAQLETFNVCDFKSSSQQFDTM